MAKKPNFKTMSIEEIMWEFYNNPDYNNGLTIMSLEASKIYDNKIYDKNYNIIKKRAVVSNSLFLVILAKYGLKVNSKGTDDVIYLSFDCNCKTELGYLNGKLKGCKRDIEKLEEKLETAKSDAMKEKYSARLESKKRYETKLESEISILTHDENGNKIPAKDLELKTKDSSVLREEYYENGFDLKVYEKGNLTRIDHYENIFQSSSKSRKGETIFLRTSSKKMNGTNAKKCIDIDKVRNEMTLGLHKILSKTPDKEIDLVSLQAYSTLVESVITGGYVRIDPKHILAIKDIEVAVKCPVAKVCTGDMVDEDWNPLKDKDDKDIESKDLRIWDEKDFDDINVLFDGQSLLDESYFEGKDYNFMLLRQHMFKSACFKCKLKDYIKNWCKEHGEDYYNDTVTDMFEHEIKYCDIEMITTDNSLKFWKFKKLFNTKDIWDYWSSKVAEYGNLFAIVKYDKPTKWDEGNMVRYSYQMINSLNCGETKDEIVENLKRLCEPTVNYINDMRYDFNRFEPFLNGKLKNNSESIFWRTLMELGVDVTKIKEFNKYWQDSTNRIRLDGYKGALLLHGTNMTILANPISMILTALNNGVHSYDFNSFGAREYNVKNPARAYVNPNRFPEHRKFVACRSPHVSSSGCMLFENMPNPELDKLFGDNLGDNIIVVDLYEFALQSMGSGFDMDSDFVACSDDETLVSVVKNNTWNQAPVPICRVAKEGAVYNYTLKDKAECDNKLASNTIGEITNKSQLLVSQLQHDKLNNPTIYKSKKDKVEEAIYKLVNSQGVSIDSAKKKFLIDLEQFLKTLDKDDKIWWKNKKGKKVYPEFFKNISKSKTKNTKCYRSLDCNVDLIGSLEMLDDTDSSRKSNTTSLDRMVSLKTETNGKLNENVILKMLNILELYYEEFTNKKNADDDDDNDENYKIYSKIKFDAKKDVHDSFRGMNETNLKYMVCMILDPDIRVNNYELENNKAPERFRAMKMFAMEVLISEYGEKISKLFTYLPK